MVERFVRARGDLPPAERKMMLGWAAVIEDYCEVDRLDGQALIAINLVDDLEDRAEVAAAIRDLVGDEA